MEEERSAAKKPPENTTREPSCINRSHKTTLSIPDLILFLTVFVDFTSQGAHTLFIYELKDCNL